MTMDWLVDFVRGWLVVEKKEDGDEDEVVGEIEWNLSIHIINTTEQRRGIDRRPEPSSWLSSPLSADM